MSANLNKVVRRVRIESAYLPTLDFHDPFQPGAPGPPNPLLQALKPKITLTINALGQTRDVVAMPYGDPGPSRWPALRNLLLVAAVGAVGYFVYRRFIR